MVNGWLIFAIVAYFVLLFVDLGLNLLTLIPYIGSVLETTSELIIEFAQVVLLFIAVTLGVDK